MTMAFGTYEAPKRECKPTFFQYLKTVSPKGIEKKTKYRVELIWLPGKFDNVTLQTHAFRYVAEPNNPLYKDVLEFINGAENVCPTIEIVITSFKDKTIEVSLNNAKRVALERIGSMGIRFKEDN